MIRAALRTALRGIVATLFLFAAGAVVVFLWPCATRGRHCWMVLTGIAVLVMMLSARAGPTQ